MPERDTPCNRQHLDFIDNPGEISGACLTDLSQFGFAHKLTAPYDNRFLQPKLFRQLNFGLTDVPHWIVDADGDDSLFFCLAQEAADPHQTGNFFLGLVFLVIKEADLDNVTFVNFVHHAFYFVELFALRNAVIGGAMDSVKHRTYPETRVRSSFTELLHICKMSLMSVP